MTISTDGLDSNGMVIHFDKVKAVLDRFDHRLILAADDPLLLPLLAAIPSVESAKDAWIITITNPPSAENLAREFADQICVLMQSDTGFVRTWAEVEVEVRESDSILARGSATWDEQGPGTRSA